MPKIIEIANKFLDITIGWLQDTSVGYYIYGEEPTYGIEITLGTILIALACTALIFGIMFKFMHT